MTTLPLRFRRHLAGSLLRSISGRRFSTVNYACNDNDDDVRNPRFIHPSSVVHPNAILGQGVLVGPFCTVGPSAVLGNNCKLHPGSHVCGNTELGDKCILMSGAIVGDNLPGKTIIGSNNVIGHHAVVGIKCQDMKYKTGVSVGPFCTVGPSAVLGNNCKLHPGSHVCGNTELGDKCILMSGAIVGDNLPGNTIIGCNNVIGHHAVVGIKCQDIKYKAGNECFLEVGDNNEIREHVSIHRSSKPCDRTVIGDNNLIMGSCHIAHDCKVGSNNIFANNTLLAGHVLVEDHAHTAGAIVVHQFCHIGSFSFIGGGSVVSQDVPKYTMVVGDRAELCGLNLEGLRRGGFSVTEIRSLKAAYKKIFMPTNVNLGGIEDRLDEVEQHEDLSLVSAVISLVQSIRESLQEDRRGICKFRSWSFS